MDALTMANENDLFSYLDEYLNANGQTPHLAGVDNDFIPFIAWLNEEGGDCVYLNVTRLVEEDGGATSRTSEETPGQGQTSSLAYPVTVLAEA